ncbi:MAG TPA: VCBS repeat-containing protein [Thermoanaerobaculia bacterium]|jgi:hypothetical protein|nr:VCBS repeat-containing protein [Thermoanaerobaculia bacterium]
MVVAFLLGALPLSSQSNVGFVSGGKFEAGGEPHDLASADFNCDTIVDLAAGNHGSQDISVVFGNRSEAFGPPTTIPLESAPQAIFSVDFNKDGAPDLLVSYGGPAFSILYGDCQGHFSRQDQQLSVAAEPAAYGDFNSDGLYDFLVIVSKGGSKRVHVFISSAGGGGDLVHSYIAGNPKSVVVADFNEDGRPDFAVADYSASPHKGGNVYVYLGVGDGSFVSSGTFSVGGNPFTIEAGDLNGDSRVDLVTANNISQNVTILLGDGRGNFPFTQTLGTDWFPTGVSIGKFGRESLPGLFVVYQYRTDGDFFKRVLSRPTLIFDPAALDDLTLVALFSALTNLKHPENWKEVPVEVGTRLSSYIENMYNLSQADNPATFAKVLASLSVVNKVEEDLPLSVNRLRVPTLPALPLKGHSRREWAQYINLDTGLTMVVENSKALTQESPPALDNARSVDAGIWVMVGSQELLSRLAGDLPEFIFTASGEALYFGAGEESSVLSLPAISSDESNPTSQEVVPSQVTEAVRKVDPKDAGFYVVLDFFESGLGTCSHGRKVLEVAQQVVRSYGGDRLVKNIVPVDLDFFKDKVVSKKAIESYINREFGDSVRAYMLSTLESLLKSSRREKYQTPLLFVQAIISNFIDDKISPVRVMSSSFKTNMDGFRVLPRNFRADGQVVMLSAVDNVENSFVETISSIEPLASYWSIRRDYAIGLVGGYKANGVPFGMTSERGDGVTFAGRGSGWGGGGNTCIQPRELGTSFSTPEVGAKLFLAQAFWKSKGLSITGVEAKRRALLASDIEPQLLGKFASAGRIAMERLLVANGTFVVEPDGKVTELNLGSDSFELVIRDGSSVETLRSLRKGDVSGVQFSGGRTFIFRDQDLQWEEIKDFTLKIGGMSFDSGADAGRVYRAIWSL